MLSSSASVLTGLKAMQGHLYMTFTGVRLHWCLAPEHHVIVQHRKSMDELPCLPDDASAACYCERHVCTTDVLQASVYTQVKRKSC